MRDKLFLYGILQGLIGAYCLLSPALFRLLADGFSFHVENASLELAADLGFTAVYDDVFHRDARPRAASASRG